MSPLARTIRTGARHPRGAAGGLACVLAALLPLAITASGCAVTHPRAVPGLQRLVEPPRRIALLPPEMVVEVKYIDTPIFFESERASDDWRVHLLEGLGYALQQDGHAVEGSGHLEDLVPGGDAELRAVNARLVELTEPVIEADADYGLRALPAGIDAYELLPPGLDEGFDLVLASRGRVRVETEREYHARWYRNIGYNVLTFPVTAAMAFVPISLPLSVNISTSIFEPNPEDCFLAILVVDARSGRLLFQNDYYSTSIPETDEEIRAVARTLLEGFRPGSEPVHADDPAVAPPPGEAAAPRTLPRAGRPRGPGRPIGPARR